MTEVAYLKALICERVNQINDAELLDLILKLLFTEG